MFNNHKNYLIIGESKTGKSSIAKKIGHDIKEEVFYFDLFDKDKKYDLSIFMNEKDKTIILDNYSVKDNANSCIKNLLKNKFISVIIVSPYALGVNVGNRMYINYVFVSVIKDNYTKSLIYSIHFKHLFKKPKFEKLINENKSFLVVNNDNKNFQYSDSVNGIGKSIVNYFKSFLF